MPLLKGGGYGHNIAPMPGFYRLSWKYDVKHGRIRYPRIMSRDTDRAGAERFAKKWGLRVPTSAPTEKT
jgi:hypothetical protein